MITKEVIPPVYSNNNIAIRLHVDSTHTFYGNPYSSQTAYNLTEELKQCNYNEEYYYINGTFRDVTIMARNGMAVAIPYVSSSTNIGFIIRKIIKMKGKSLKSALIGIQNSVQIDDPELLEIKKALLSIDVNSYAYTSIMIDYQISIDDIKKKGGTIYHYQTDLLVSFEEYLKVDAHPYSTKFLSIGTFGILNDYLKQKDFNVKIKYVNHEQNANPIYINLLGKVFTIAPQRDSPARQIVHPRLGTKTFDDYILFSYSSHCDPDVISGTGVTTIKMTLEEAKEKLGIYDTFELAVNYGNLDVNRKSELSKLNHQIELLKQSNSLEKARLDKEDFDRRQEFAKEKAKLDRDDYIRKQDLLVKEHDLEMLRKETATLKQDLELSTQRLNIEVLECKRKQSALDIKMQEVDNEEKLVDIKCKQQEDILDRERKIFDEKIKTLREENEYRLKQESLYWRDFYDRRSYERKDVSEVLKFIPGLIIGVIGIAVTIIKMSKPV